jgi:hypothetical protein
LLKAFGLECPRQSPQPIRCISTGRQGANQLQLALGQHNGFGIEADFQARFAALNGFDDGELGSTRLLDTDQIAGMERCRGQEISPRDSRRAAGPRCGRASRRW